MADVLIEGLSFRYPGSSEATLAGLDLRIGSGEAHALLGGSGAGKSTLLNLLSGLLPVQSGSLRINGVDVAPVAAAERGVSQVFQFPVLYESMTVAENLAFPLKTHGMARADRLARVQEVAAHLDIGHLLQRRPAALSLFEKQFAAIAKALIRPDVSVVLLDEPLTAAEPSRKWQLRKSLQALQRESGATMIYVTHDQTEALTFADRISVMHQGRILQSASPQLLLDKPQHEHVGYFVGAPGMNFIDVTVDDGGCVIGGGAPSALSFRDALSLRAAPASLAATVTAVVHSGCCRLGFRPEWAEFHSASDAGQQRLHARITSIRVLGTHRGQAFGLVAGTVAGVAVITRQLLGGLQPGQAWLEIARLRVFRDGWLVDA